MSDLQDRLQTALGSTYRVERELGGGGMSRVYVAEEVALARKVVVKVLPPEMAAGVNAERFRREIQLAASLQHPHIVPLLNAGQSGDIVWYTMPLIEGESLRARLARERELPVAEAVRLLRDVADALAYAHEPGRLRPRVVARRAADRLPLVAPRKPRRVRDGRRRPGGAAGHERLLARVQGRVVPRRPAPRLPLQPHGA